jgi:CRISPR-associated endonuclease/helicase Cas3
MPCPNLKVLSWKTPAFDQAMNATQFLAHTDQSLVKHLLGVARRAKEFATHFQGEDHAELAGLLHDLGKADAEFQKRIAKAAGLSKEDGDKRPHAHHGAALALASQLWPVAFAINGHHAGLHNRSDLQQVPAKWTSPARGCEGMLKGDGDWGQQKWPIAEFGKTLPAWLEEISFTTAIERDAKMRAVDFYTRMLFSALVDADRLDTEDANRADGSQANVLKRKAWRFGSKCLAANGAAESLLKMLDTAIKDRIAAARSKNASDAVMGVRAEVLAACEEKAFSDRGVFTLAVPTGGGKTLASVAFALHHIAHHNKDLAEDDPSRLRRIVLVIPYLNIIQQTTRELNTVFAHTEADPIILEHHSQATDPIIKKNDDADGWDKERSLRQLAVENWDAPIIVTTSVQFFDSLFSRRPADARKLHNICQSVLIFDEVQTLPPLLLQPILDALKELTSKVRRYGSSLVLCTATQPALGKSEDFEFGFENVIPIIRPDVSVEHFRRLKRVEYAGLAKDSPPPILDHEALAAAISVAPRKQALAILNTRKQARVLFDLIMEKTKADDELRDSIFHLSTWMYPAHRLQVLAEITKRLNQKKPCLLVSTQCIEAGVDVDFPAVWRAFGPYDSIVQAAGRCNRNGGLTDDSGQSILGQVHVFTPTDPAAPQGTYGSAMQNADLLRRMGKAEPDNPNSFEIYFRLFYQTTVPDPGGCAVQSAREKLHFEEANNLFRFIEADAVPLLIENDGWAKLPAPEGSDTGKTLLEWLQNPQRFRLVKNQKGGTFRANFLTADEWRLIQPYIVNIGFPTSDKTREFLRNYACLVFKDDDATRGLHRLTATHFYSDGPHGAGINVMDPSLTKLDYCP